MAHVPASTRLRDAVRPTGRNAFRIVLWQVILYSAIACTGAEAQVGDSNQVVTDSIRKHTFPETNPTVPRSRIERTLDVAATGGAGAYYEEAGKPFQATANVDFFAQTSLLDLTAGFHWGFSDPATKGLSIGLRLPITENRLTDRGLYGDASLLFFDNGHDTNAFQTGLRGALVERIPGLHLEARAVAEIRRWPIGDNHFEGWFGAEVGFFTTILREQIHDPTRRDSLKASLKYIATTAELEELNRISDEDLGAWLDRFWSARAITEGTNENQARLEYERRIAVANRLYSTGRRMGVETDQGRVLLIYGEPDRTETGPSIIDPAIRYMLWVYGGRVRGYQEAMFLFSSHVGSTSGHFAAHGEYRQVYSNVIGEYSEGVPYDVPPAMKSYVENFGR